MTIAENIQRLGEIIGGKWEWREDRQNFVFIGSAADANQLDKVYASYSSLLTQFGTLTMNQLNKQQADALINAWLPNFCANGKHLIQDFSERTSRPSLISESANTEEVIKFLNSRVGGAWTYDEHEELYCYSPLKLNRAIELATTLKSMGALGFKWLEASDNIQLTSAQVKQLEGVINRSYSDIDYPLDEHLERVRMRFIPKLTSEVSIIEDQPHPTVDGISQAHLNGTVQKQNGGQDFVPTEPMHYSVEDWSDMGVINDRLNVLTKRFSSTEWRRSKSHNTLEIDLEKSVAEKVCAELKRNHVVAVPLPLTENDSSVMICVPVSRRNATMLMRYEAELSAENIRNQSVALIERIKVPSPAQAER